MQHHLTSRTTTGHLRQNAKTKKFKTPIITE